MKTLRNAACAATLPFFFYACANNSDQGPSGSAITAYVAKGPVTGAQCKLHQASNDKVLAGPVESKEGHVDFGAVSYQGLAYVACQGGNYIDEISGYTFNLGTGELRSAQVISGATNFTVTPVTEIAVKRAYAADPEGTLTAANVAQSNKDTADYFGLSHVDIVTENPADITRQAAEDTPAGWYGAVLASLSGLVVSESGMDELTEKSIVDIGIPLRQMVSRLSDPAKNNALLDSLIVELNGLTNIKPNPVSDVILSGITVGLGSETDHVPGTVNTVGLDNETDQVPGTVNHKLSVRVVKSAVKQDKFTFDVMGTGFGHPMQVLLGDQEVTEFTVHSGTHLSLTYSVPSDTDSPLTLTLKKGSETLEFPNAFTPAACDSCSKDRMPEGCSV